MIKTEAEFEAALEEIVDLLEHPFAGGPADRLNHLMAEIQTWKPELISGEPEDDATAAQRKALQNRLNRFEKELRMHHPNVMTDFGTRLGLFEDAPEPRRELGDPQQDLSTPNGIGG